MHFYSWWHIHVVKIITTVIAKAWWRLEHNVLMSECVSASKIKNTFCDILIKLKPTWVTARWFQFFPSRSMHEHRQKKMRGGPCKQNEGIKRRKNKNEAQVREKDTWSLVSDEQTFKKRNQHLIIKWKKTQKEHFYQHFKVCTVQSMHSKLYYFTLLITWGGPFIAVFGLSLIENQNQSIFQIAENNFDSGALLMIFSSLFGDLLGKTAIKVIHVSR